MKGAAESVGLIPAEYQQALWDLRLAEQRFSHADPDYIEAASYALTAAQSKVSALIHEEKAKRNAATDVHQTDENNNGLVCFLKRCRLGGKAK